MEFKKVNETKIIIKYVSNVFNAEPFIAGNEHYSIFLIFLLRFQISNNFIQIITILLIKTLSHRNFSIVFREG